MKGLISMACRTLAAIQAKVGLNDFVLFWLRAWVAHVFYASGRTKTGGTFLTPSDMTLALFEDEYQVPLLPPDLAAQLAVYAETFLPLLLMVGLASRLGAVGLLGMTMVIQLFVYPGHFAEHLTWAVALLTIMVMGPGRLSLDQLLFGRRPER